MSADALTSLDEIVTRLERALATSPADSTELVWIETRRAQVTAGHGRREAPRPSGPGGKGGAAGAAAPAGGAAHERSLLVRVRQSGRTGLHRTAGSEPSELENAVRDALAQARLAPASAAEPLASGERRGEAAGARTLAAGAAGDPAAAGPGGAGQGGALHDPDLAELEPGRVRALLDGVAERGEQLRLTWLEGQVAIVNTAGLRRSARVTAASFEARCGRGPGGGAAAGAARRFDGLYLQDTLDRARARHAGDGVAAHGAVTALEPQPGPPAAPAAPTPAALPANVAVLPADLMLVLSEQCVAALLDLLNRHALSSAAQRDTGSCRHRRLGEPLLASCLSLRDDGTDPRTLPFPFDLAGWPKRRVDLVVDGVFATPAVDVRLAQEIGRSPTPHAMAPDESIAANLLLLPGDRAPLPEAELLRQAEGGIWVGELGGLECFDTGRLRFRAVARGVRRITGGALGPPLPDLVWEDDLPAALARGHALGDQPVTVATGDMLFGATAAPLLALRAASKARV
jgi:predicted Zn-dependent protease